jgi:SPP1 gp7 family putative phage head morphogenesis protein
VRRLLGGTARTEQRRQERLLRALERRYESRMRAALERGYRATIAAYEAGEGFPVDTAHEREVRDLVQEMATASVATFAGRIVTQGKALGRLETKEPFADMFARLALRYIGQEAVRQRITSISQTTRSQMVAAVMRGQSEGLGVDAIGRIMRDLVPGLSAYRGNLIARTETHGAANYGADQAARETGLVLRKEWVAAEDERTRPEHAEANGTVVDMDETFTVGADEMLYPGDTRGSPENTINCRCAIAHVVID